MFHIKTNLRNKYLRKCKNSVARRGGPVKRFRFSILHTNLQRINFKINPLSVQENNDVVEVIFAAIEFCLHFQYKYFIYVLFYLF